MITCSVPGCDATVKAKALCDAHYQRNRTTGSVGTALVKRRNLTLEERFWRGVEPGSLDACWPWRGACLPYGKVTDSDGRQRPAHRVSLEIHLGRKVPAALEVLHSCDNPACVNPHHLSEGTHADNMAEMSVRRRAAAGERSAVVKLSTSDVHEVHRLATTGLTNMQIAGRFDVNQSTISRILTGKRRPDVPVSLEGDRRRRKLSNGDVGAIRAAMAQGVPADEIAGQYNINSVYAQHIARGHRR